MMDNEYFDYLIKQLPLIAQNQRMLLDPVYIEGLKKLGTRASRLALFAIEDFKMLRDEMSKTGQFNEFIKSLGAIQAAMAMGNQELLRLTTQLRAFKKEAEMPTKFVIAVPGLSGLGFPEFPNLPTAPGLAPRPAQAIREVTDAMAFQMQIVGNLQGMFTDMFYNVVSGLQKVVIPQHTLVV
jgi:hypothetical protein